MKELIKTFWTDNAPYKGLNEWERVDARHTNEPYIRPILDSLYGKILEIGCGLGYDTFWLRLQKKDVTPIDLSPENAREAGGLCMDAEELGFFDNTFDTVYSFGVLHHTPDTQKAIDEIYRVLKPKGKIVIMIYHKGYAYWILKLLGKSMNDYDHTPLSKLYSTKEAYHLFRRFRNLSIELTTYAPNKCVWFLFTHCKFLMDRFGSFLIIRGEK